MSHPAPRGYIGLIALLITAALAGLLFWYATPKNSSDASENSSYVEQELDAVDAARNAKQLTERAYGEQQKQVGD